MTNMTISINGFIKELGDKMFEAGVLLNHEDVNKGEAASVRASVVSDGSIKTGGRYEVDGALVDGEVHLYGKSKKAIGQVGHKRWGALNLEYNPGKNITISYQPSKFVNKIRRYGSVGTALAAALVTYGSIPSDNPYRAAGSMLAGAVIGSLIYILTRGRKAEINLNKKSSIENE